MIDDRENRLGRRGEILASIVMQRFGWTILDAAMTGGNRATLLNRAGQDLVSPDLVMVKSIGVLGEVKTKAQHLAWSGGKRDGLPGHMPPGPAHGIDRIAYLRYQDVQRLQRLPVILFVISIEDAELVAGTLDRLGTPYPSEDPRRHDMVNWPLSWFQRLFTFHPRYLNEYFYHRDGTARQPPNPMPGPSERQKLFELLRPQQQEFAGFRQHVFDLIEKRWGK